MFYCADEKPTPFIWLNVGADFLCTIDDNNVGLNVYAFRISDTKTRRIFFQIDRNPNQGFFFGADLNKIRHIKLDFERSFLNTQSITTFTTFSVGAKDIGSLRMVERTYFRNELVITSDAEFGPCAANSTNTWEQVLSLPELAPELKQQMIDNPYETTCDTFFFADGRLIIHNKASYAFRSGPL